MAVRQIKGGLAGHPYTLLLSCLASLFLGGLLHSRARLRFGWRCKNNIISPQEQNPNRIISLILVHLITPSQKQPNFCPLHPIFLVLTHPLLVYSIVSRSILRVSRLYSKRLYLSPWHNIQLHGVPVDLYTWVQWLFASSNQ